MYSISNIENVFDVMAYTMSALQESGYTDSEIECYVSSALKLDNNLEIVELSREWLEECSKIYADDISDSYDDYIYDCLTGIHRKKESWEYDNAVDDVEQDEEAYEGFSSCKNYKWDSSMYEDDPFDEDF